MVNQLLKWFKSNPLIALGIVILLGIFIWYFQTKLWNGVGNLIFATKMSWQEKNLQKELESAAAQQKEIDKTLTELALVKQEKDAAKAETDRLKTVFADQSKSASEKVAEFKKSVSEGPIKTPTDNITTESLCERARSMGASQATVQALCGN